MNPPLMRLIAAAYDNAPVFAPAAKHAWLLLAAHSEEEARKLRRTIDVHFTADETPYSTERVMFSDIDHGRLILSTAHCDHPLWTPMQNLDFRLCHDVRGHYAAKSGFDWSGEFAAHEAHAASLPDDISRAALLTEVLGQAASALINGRFPLQKAAMLW